MKPSRKFSFFSSSTTTTTVIYSHENDHTTPLQTREIPIESPSVTGVVHPDLPQPDAAATKIQSAYRAHLIRTLYRKISSVNSEADQLQREIQRQETVDAIRSNEKERLRMNEALMALLLKLDSVPGIDPTLREGRRKVSRRIVGLQEIMDAICDAKMEENGDFEREWDPQSGLWRYWDDVVGKMEEEACRERGGEEMERFCAQYLGFRCLQRFLRE